MAGVEYPQNDFTRMIEAVGRTNAAGGGRGLMPVHTGGAPPAVRSEAMRNPQPVEEPMSAAEVAELNRLAIEAGVVDPRLGNAPGAISGGPGGDASQSQYENMSLEEVIAAGASVRQPEPPPALAPSAGPMLTRQNRHGVVGGVARPQPPATPAPVVVQQPRLPNFRNVQGIDLVTGEVFVDDMSFKISPQDLSEFRRYAVEVARSRIMQQLEEAMNLFTQETAEDQDGRNEAESEGSDATLQSNAEGNSA